MPKLLSFTGRWWLMPASTVSRAIKSSSPRGLLESSIHWYATNTDLRSPSKPVRLVAPRSVLARLRCYHAPRRFQRDVVAHHFPDVILQFCLNAEHGIDSL